MHKVKTKINKLSSPYLGICEVNVSANIENTSCNCPVTGGDLVWP